MLKRFVVTTQHRLTQPFSCSAAASVAEFVCGSGSATATNARRLADSISEAVAIQVTPSENACSAVGVSL